jgi:hypothetical protein
MVGSIDMTLLCPLMDTFRLAFGNSLLAKTSASLEAVPEDSPLLRNILWLFNTCGPVVGLSMFAAGLVALGLCAWATRPASSPKGRRIAMRAALAPIVVGLCGALSGLVYFGARNLTGADWLSLGKVCLAGLVVSAVPLVWALLLLRLRRGPA